MAKDKKSSDIKNYYAISKGKTCGIFKQWSQAKPLVDKYSGAAYKGFVTLEKAIKFMLKGGFGLKDIMVYEDANTFNVGNGENVSDFASRNGITFSIDEGASNSPPSDTAQESDTEEKYIDAAEDITVHIDGSCTNNGNVNTQSKAGIGIYWGPGHNLNVSAPVTHEKKTNNVAELKAAIGVVQQIKDNNLSNVVIKADSQYVINGITSWVLNWKENNWLKSDGAEVENKELWIQLDNLNAEVKPKWQHIGRELNGCADKLAKDGSNMEPTPGSAPPTIEKQSVSSCVICNEEAVKDVLPCSGCAGKVHFKCSGLPNYQVATYRKSQRKFTCEICVISAGDVNATEARKSCGGPIEVDSSAKRSVLNHVQNASEKSHFDCCEKINCIKEDVSDMKISLGNFESEILKIVSKLCDENTQMKEKECESRVEIAVKEKQDLSQQIQKLENREKEMKVQMDNLRDKNIKLSVECENLRENIARRKETDANLTAQIREKDGLISSLNDQLKQASEHRKTADETTHQNDIRDREQVVQSNISVKNRFEPETMRQTQHSRIARSDVEYVKGHREPLSNFYRMKFQWQGRTYHSVEQAFQHEKATRHRNTHVAEKILNAKHAGIANKIGHDIQIHPLWDREKEGIMYHMLREKKTQNKEFRDALLRSGDKKIVCDIPDRFWGIGKDENGRNVLGLMLMDIRKEIATTNRDVSNETKPVVAIIGSSLIRNLDGFKFSRHYQTDVRTAYTIPQATDTVRTLDRPNDVIVYQLLSNDMKVKGEQECVRDLENLVKLTKNIQPCAKIVISLPPNRGDSELYNVRTNIINARVKSIFAGDDKVSMCDNSNLAFRGKPDKRYIDIDGVHLTPAGDKALFANIRQAVRDALTPQTVC